MKPLLDLVRAHKSGKSVGIYSVCSSHPLVLEAALRLAERCRSYALIEATCNQVNQEGGYTGMRPAEFFESVHRLAANVGLPAERVLLGGDHLGPNCWKSLPYTDAMQRAAVLVRDYVEAGFRKIHLDCSMSCADDPAALGDELIAARAAGLCEVAEQAAQRSGAQRPVYIIGSEVPVPGGSNETMYDLAVTTPDAAAASIEAHRRAFSLRGLEDAWKRVIGIVVQPGVEFDHQQVVDYQPLKASALSRSIVPIPGMVFEAHSTDYQTPSALANLVSDHFAILKVGPAATFVMREAFWALAAIATELGLDCGDSLRKILLEEMRREPKHWSAYYKDRAQQHVDLQFSLSDRIRYYWGSPAVSHASYLLLAKLTAIGIPLTLLSQYMPVQFAAVRNGQLDNSARALVLDGVAQLLRGYMHACGQDDVCGVVHHPTRGER